MIDLKNATITKSDSFNEIRANDGYVIKSIEPSIITEFDDDGNEINKEVYECFHVMCVPADFEFSGFEIVKDDSESVI